MKMNKDLYNVLFLVVLFTIALILVIVYTQPKDTSESITPSEIPSASSSGSNSIVDDTYNRNADQAAWEAIDYCKLYPYGTYRTTIYNSEGIGVPFSIKCSTLG